MVASLGAHKPPIGLSNGRPVAYPGVLGAGLTVAELPDQNARIELRFLIAEIKRMLR